MKKLIIPLAIFLVAVFLVTGCGSGSSSTPTPAATTPPATTSGPTSTTPAAGQPVSGGTYTIIQAAGPQVLSYVPDMGPADAAAVFPAVERLIDTNTDRAKGLDGVLAEKWSEDPTALTITFNIRKGVKFSDGSDMNADVAMWNLQLLVDAKRLQYQSAFKSMETPDPYILVIHLNNWTNQLLPSWGWSAMFSKKAWTDASGGDLAKGKEWAKTHVVGTGPFVLQEFVRDDHMNYVKNANYWRPGKPYLDKVNYRFIPDSVTATSIMQAKQADEWRSPDASNEKTLLAAGLKAQQSWPALIWQIVPNTATADSKWNNLKLRQAVAYALNTPAITQAVGQGLYFSLTSLPPKDEWGYDANYKGPGYDVAKAKQLLTEAGYPNGLSADLLIGNDPVSQDAGTAIKQYLDAAGIKINLDVADPGRYYGSIWGTNPYKDLAFLFSGEDTNYLMTYMRWFSSDPFTNLAGLGRPQEQKDLDAQASQLTDEAQKQQMTGTIMKWFNEQQRVIPVYGVPAVAVVQPWVHSTEYTTGFVRWQMEELWMDKH